MNIVPGIQTDIDRSMLMGKLHRLANIGSLGLSLLDNILKIKSDHSIMVYVVNDVI